MSPVSDGLRRLASDLGHAADAIEGVAAAGVTAAATAVETRARALDVSTGVAVTMEGPTTARVASTQRMGVASEVAGPSVVPANTAAVADRLADRLLTDGRLLIIRGRA